ncbi:cell division protein FtsW [Leucobacter sp. OH2974_COT-288]|nr:cell division protein FtsW [Leucobacter sp. OH2974_COT-288]
MSKTNATVKALREGLRLRAIREADAVTVWLFAATLGLIGLGVLMVMSASSVNSYLAERGPWGEGFRHAGYALVAIVAMLFAGAIKPHWYMRFALVVFGGGVLLQSAVVFTGLGVADGGNRNWLRIGSLQVQPSEFLKLGAILILGVVIQRLVVAPRGKLLQEIIPLGLFAGLPLALIVWGKDLGTAMVLGLAVLGCLLFGEIKFRTIAVFAVTGIFAAFLFVISSENRRNRIASLWGDSKTDYSGLDWQPLHGVWALSSGGVFGNGLGSSKAKWSWLPAAEDDYIFAIIGEELGLFGCLAVIVAYIVLAWAMLRVITRAKNYFQKAVVGGIMMWIVGQAFINIAVVLRLLPVLGVPLPFVSAGGTALVACCMAMGVVITIARDTAPRQEQTETHQNASQFSA